MVVFVPFQVAMDECRHNVYSYDDIGNRITADEIIPASTNIPSTAYTANNLNQYTSISNLCNSASSAFSAGDNSLSPQTRQAAPAPVF